MAIASTYSFSLIQNIDLTQGPTTSQADATSLANGGFAVSGFHVGHTDLDIFNADLSDDGGNNVFGFTNSAIDQLSSGNIVTVGQDANSIRYVITNATGAIAFAETDFGDADSSNADVAALTGGGFWVVAQDEIGAAGGDADIDVYIRNNDGSFANFFTVDASVARDTNARVAALDNGGAVVTWQRTIGADTEIWYAVYNSVGGVVQGPTIADTIGTINRNVDVSAKNNGFVLVYEDNGWGTGTTDITMAEFDLLGTFQSFNNISNPTFINDFSNDANATVTRLANGLLVVGYENNAFADTDSVVKLFDVNTDTVLATRFVTAGESIADDTGEIAIAGSANGGINVFHSNFSDSDAEGEALVGRRTTHGDGANDVFFADDFIDIINGNGGDDNLAGGGNDDTVSGGDNDDVLRGDAGGDILNGDAGADTLSGGTGIDTLAGGTGNDTYIVSDADVLTEFVNQGYDTVNTTLASFTLGANFERVNSTSGANFVGTGNALNNRFQSLGGDDRFVDVAGGADIFSGGNGTDTIDFRTSVAGVVLNFVTDVHGGAAAGDTYAAMEKYLGSNTAGDTMTAGGVGRFVFVGGGGNDNLTGGVKNDQLIGQAGNDTLAGGADKDSLQGGLNNDTMNGGADADVFVYSDQDADFGDDIINAFEDGLDSFKVHSNVADNVADFSISGNGSTTVILTLIADPAHSITINGASPITITNADFVFY